MAQPQRKNPAADDARHPDTVTDSGGRTPKLEPETYGFRTIEGVEPAEGKGSVDPVRVRSASALATEPIEPANSTFSSRSKAVQASENKAVSSAESK